jgi:hypothetical protein
VLLMMLVRVRRWAGEDGGGEAARMLAAAA